MTTQLSDSIFGHSCSHTGMSIFGDANKAKGHDVGLHIWIGPSMEYIWEANSVRFPCASKRRSVLLVNKHTSSVSTGLDHGDI